MAGGSDPTVEEALIRRAKAKDTEAFGWLVERYQARIYSYIRRLVRSREEAEDLTQDTFVKAYRNIDRYDGRASMATWLFRIASNLCIDASRNRSRRVDAVSIEIMPVRDPEDGTWNPELHSVAGEMRAAVEAAIADLKEPLRAVLLLHDVEGLTYEEIAGVVDVPLGTVKSRLFVARKSLQKALSPFLEGGVSQ